MIKIKTDRTIERSNIVEDDLPCIGVHSDGRLFFLTCINEYYHYLSECGAEHYYDNVGGLTAQLRLAPKGTTFTITQE